MTPIRVVATIRPAGLSPRQLREHFAESLRQALFRAYQTQRLDAGQTEELYRTLPPKGDS